ncbi:acyl-CoA N-acyltransferase [Stachybotrys elegans]|uniref:Acyl-CoA N-acyltransferase n=1 Tax=Stachybotrys elegans TaxID=80388 RepID=A0A8K0WKC4_9HYPO|nr:acyl-CoA N-acyltransferase [Stachybotrys elegans]
MFFTERLMFRCLDPEVDGHLWLQWTNDLPLVNALSAQGAQPWSRERSKKYLEDRVKDKDALPWFMVCEKPADSELPSALGPNDDYFRTADGKARYPAIGCLHIDKMGGVTDVNGIVYMGILLDAAHQDRGYGTEALRWVCDYIFTTLGYRRIEGSADASNARGLNVYKKLGFTEEGRRRQRFWRDGEWRDVVEYGVLREEWLSSANSYANFTQKKEGM